jgi:nucleoside recognition membrane protein YjiH
LFELAKVGVQIDMASRISMSIDDVLGLLPSYGPVIALSLLLGFALMGVIRKYRPRTTFWVYPLAGALAMLVMLLAMHPLMQVTLIAGARSSYGLVAQVLAGFAGGWLFKTLRQHG